MNFFVTSKLPDDYTSYSAVERFSSYQELLQGVERALAGNQRKATTGPLKSDWAVGLLQDLEVKNYRATIGPPLAADKKTEQDQLQIYFIAQFTYIYNL